MYTASQILTLLLRRHVYHPAHWARHISPPFHLHHAPEQQDTDDSILLDPCLLPAQSAGGRSAGLTAAWKRKVNSEILGGHCGRRSQHLDLGWEEGISEQEKQKLFPKDIFEFEVTLEHTIKVPMMYIRMEDRHLSWS